MSEYFQEKLHREHCQSLSIDQVIYQGKSDFQNIMIFDNAIFGRVLTLDGVVQTTEADEFIYHEMFAHVPILSHGRVKRVLIIGGGDGGLLREVCRHQDIEHITMVEIDTAVVQLAQQHLPKHSNGAFDDPRVKLIIGDGLEWLQQGQASYDLILSDSTDPIGPGEALFSDAFYQDCKANLNPDGILVTMNGVRWLQYDALVNTHRKLSAHMQDVTFYHFDVPTYSGGNMHLIWGSDEKRHRQQDLPSIKSRFDALNMQTRYYNPDIHLASFCLDQSLKNSVEQNQREIISCQS